MPSKQEGDLPVAHYDDGSIHSGSFLNGLERAHSLMPMIDAIVDKFIAIEIHCSRN